MPEHDRIIPLAVVRVRVEMQFAEGHDTKGECDFYRKEIREALVAKGYVVRAEGETGQNWDTQDAWGSTRFYRTKEIPVEELEKIIEKGWDIPDDK